MQREMWRILARSMMVITAIVSLLLFSGCGGAKKPKEIKESKRPSLMYQPGMQSQQLKYPLKVGVLTLRDSRPVLFYNSDEYFQEEDPAKALSDMMFAEMRASGLFGQVVRIPIESPAKLDSNFLKKLRHDHQIDMALVGDLTGFHLTREKMGSQNVKTSKVGVSLRLVGQLVYLEQPFIVWSGQTLREESQVAENGMVDPRELGHLANTVTRTVMNDVKAMITQTGKEMVIR